MRFLTSDNVWEAVLHHRPSISRLRPRRRILRAPSRRVARLALGSCRSGRPTDPSRRDLGGHRGDHPLRTSQDEGKPAICPRPVVCLRCPHRVGRSVGTSARRACLPFSRRSTDTTVSVPEQGLGSGRSTRRSRAVAHSRSPPHRRVAVDRQWCQPQASRHAGRPHLGVGRSRSLRTSLPTARSGSSICDGEPEQASIADLALRPATLGAIDRGPRVTVTAPRSSLCATCGSG